MVSSPPLITHRLRFRWFSKMRGGITISRAAADIAWRHRGVGKMWDHFYLLYPVDRYAYVSKIDDHICLPIQDPVSVFLSTESGSTNTVRAWCPFILSPQSIGREGWIQDGEWMEKYAFTHLRLLSSKGGPKRLRELSNKATDSHDLQRKAESVRYKLENFNLLEFLASLYSRFWCWRREEATTLTCEHRVDYLQQWSSPIQLRLLARFISSRFGMQYHALPQIQYPELVKTYMVNTEITLENCQVMAISWRPLFTSPRQNIIVTF